MTQWTKEQEEAIRARGSNLLVAAAAGSGKTAVLVTRIIDLIIEDRVDINKMLIVTFTNAAAGEMRERIAKALTLGMEKQKDQEEHFRKQLHLLNKSYITTLHSFCIEVVRKSFHLLNIDPNFRIGDEAETGTLKQEALEEIFEDAYLSEDPRFHGLVERFGGSKDDTPLQELVLKLYQVIQSQPYPFEWLDQAVADFNKSYEELKASSWYRALLSEVNLELMGARALLEEAKEICNKVAGPVGYLNTIVDDLNNIDSLWTAGQKDLKILHLNLKETKHKIIGRCSKDVDERLKEEAKKLRDEAKTIVVERLGQALLAKDPEVMVQELNQIYPYMKCLAELIQKFAATFTEKKLEKGIVDFNDLEHLALQALSHPDVAQYYREHFDHLFVDEYQDSNIVQETILNFIKREDNLFLVGDVKQSIYRFRLADPTLFIEKYETYSKDKEDINRRIDLAKNFRSRGEILAGVNFIFKNTMSKAFGEIEYDEKAYLYQGLEMEPIADPSIEVLLIEKNLSTASAEEVGVEELEELEDVQVEALAAAKLVREIMASEIYDERLKAYRKAEYSDIALLLRTTRNWSPVFLEIFTKEGIPCYGDTNSGYFDTLEINIFLNLIKAVDNRRDDLALLSVLRSPIGGFSIDELVEIRIKTTKGSFYEALSKYANDEKDALALKLRRFNDQLLKWVEEARYMKIPQFIWKLLMETNYFYYVGAMPGGLQRQANLRIFVDRARQFEETSIKGLFNFVKFIEKLRNSSGDMGTAKILSENDNVLRIMSIHKSKGLEFPFVIVAGLGKQFNQRDNTASLLIHKELGLGPKYVDPDLRIYGDTLPRLAMKNKLKIEGLSEEMRILYVALTRAKDKLYLVGSQRDLSKKVEQWSKRITPYQLAKAKTYLDWIGPVLLRHQDGQVLREKGSLEWGEEMLWEDASKWRLRLTSRAQICKEEAEEVKEEATLKNLLTSFPGVNTKYKELIQYRLNWQYPHKVATMIPSKISVTDIKRASMKHFDAKGLRKPSLVKVPKFLEGAKVLSGVEKGTIVHFVLQHFDLTRVYSREAIEKQIKQMIEKELLYPVEAEVIDIDKLLNFFNSEIGQRLLQASRVEREVAFNLVKRASEIDIEEASEETLLIQGVIDCFFEEEDGLVLLDYKTDVVLGKLPDEAIERYTSQLTLYKEALESLSGKKVKESYLYLFDLDKGVKL